MEERVIIYCDKITYWIKPNEICVMQALGSYTAINLLDGRVLKVSKNLKSFLSSFFQNCNYFFRVHKSFAINLNHVEYLFKRHGHLTLFHLSNGMDIPISNYEIQSKIMAKYGLLEDGTPLFDKKHSINKNISSKRNVIEKKIKTNEEQTSESIDDNYIMISINNNYK